MSRGRNCSRFAAFASSSASCSASRRSLTEPKAPKPCCPMASLATGCSVTRACRSSNSVAGSPIGSCQAANCSTSRRNSRSATASSNDALTGPSLRFSMAELLVEHLSKSFPTRTDPLIVLRDVSLSLAAGQNAAILGPSGSGKSTLLFIIGTLDTPSEGSVRLNGADPFSLSEPKLAEFRNRHIGFVFQDHYVLPQLTVLENVLIPAMADGAPPRETVGRARQLLARVGLAERLDHRPAELSGGERQRVGVARALLLKPALVLADEPTGNLDRKSAAAIGDLLVEMQREEQAMLLVVTHSLELAGRFEKRYEINDGKLAEGH